MQKSVAEVIIYFKLLYFFLNKTFFFLWVYTKIIRVKMFCLNSNVI